MVFFLFQKDFLDECGLLVLILMLMSNKFNRRNLFL
uniref:Uncharacterized protein n=1 Tax=Lepeophtheirus salmonis TaxID=72036 RepID=A0A0K2UGG5_LEPSM